MYHKDRSEFERWCALVAAVALLVLCLVLLSGQAVTAESAAAPGVAVPQRPDVAAPMSRAVLPAANAQRANPGGLETPPVSFLASALPDGLGIGSSSPHFSPPLHGGTDFVVCMATDRVWGVIGAGETATVRTTASWPVSVRMDREVSHLTRCQPSVRRSAGHWSRNSAA